MKFVAAARLRRAQEAALAARPYAKELTRVLRSTISRIAEPQHPLLARRPEERVLALVLTGERGLAGAFNTNLLRRANEFFRPWFARKNSFALRGRLIPTFSAGRTSFSGRTRAGNSCSSPSAKKDGML